MRARKFANGLLRPIVKVARKFRRSAAFKSVIAAPKRLAVANLQRANRGIFSVEIEANCGFFAVMQMVLFILMHCKRNGLYPDISAKGGIYGDRAGTVDWFALLFERVEMPEASIAQRLERRDRIKTSRIKGVEELGFRSRYEQQLSLAQASALFREAYRPAADVQANVDALARQLGISSSTLAVHYRGTDKIHEAGRIPWQQLSEAVEHVAERNPALTEIFLASDDVAFIDFFRNHPFRLPVILAPAAYMPRGDAPVHFSGHPGLEIGREALVTCLLLARCGYLVKTPSYLSGWAKIFTPLLPVWLISPPLGLGYFPDRVLWVDQAAGRMKATPR
jgi:hypothetical protein